MTKYLAIYHGIGKQQPSTKEEGEKIMQAWVEWFNLMGDAVVERGNPVGMSTTVNSDATITNNGGSNPIGGYTILQADNIDGVLQLLKKCPSLKDGMSIEVAEIVNIM